MQLGPTRAMPYFSAVRTTCSSRARPSGPVSENPAETTTTALTPFRPHSSTTPSTREALTAMMARSGASGRSVTLWCTGSPRMVPPLGLTR